MDDAESLNPVWWRRYTATATRLDRTFTMVRLQRLVDRVDLDGPPAAVPVAGEAQIRRARRVGLFAGSFNPLTLAHVALARAARRHARLDFIVWAFAAVTVDKERVARASLPDRLAQMAQYVGHRRSDALVVLNRGLYVDEARALRTLLPQNAELTILVGFDKIVQILDPRYYADRDAALDELFAEARLLVAPRDDAGQAELDALLAKPRNRRYADRVGILPLPDEYARDSSTEARQRAALEAQPAELADLLPPEGAALACATAAYRPSTNAKLDTYALRQAWLHALQAQPQRHIRRLPPLSALVGLALRADQVGIELRRYLSAPERNETALGELVERGMASAGLSLSPAAP